jgi:hypothetical protein
MLKKKIAEIGNTAAIWGLGLSIVSGMFTLAGAASIGVASLIVAPALSEKQVESVKALADPLLSSAGFSVVAMFTSIAIGAASQQLSEDRRSVPKECKSCAFFNPDSVFYGASMHIPICAVHPMGKPYQEENCPDFEKKPER